MKQYFYITHHFSPWYDEIDFCELQNGYYKDTVHGDIYRKRLMYDFGWGQEEGFELLPELPFDSLIRLIEEPSPPAVSPKTIRHNCLKSRKQNKATAWIHHFWQRRKNKFYDNYMEAIKQNEVLSETHQLWQVWKNNFYGAAAVIMQDHVEELIDYLDEKIGSNYFSDSSIRKNFKVFSFSSEKTKENGTIPGGVLTESYEDILNRYPKWQRIRNEVIDSVYE